MAGPSGPDHVLLSGAQFTDNQAVSSACLSLTESLSELRCGVFDTGCTKHCFTSDAEPYFTDIKAGNAMQGAFGSAQRGLTGTTFAYICSADGNHSGSSHRLQANVQPGLSRDLLSTDHWSESEGFRFAYDEQTKFRGLTNDRGDWLPGYRNPTSRLLECVYVLGSTESEAIASGLRCELQLQRASARALLWSKNNFISNAAYAKVCTEHESISRPATECGGEPLDSSGVEPLVLQALLSGDVDDAVIKGIRRGLRPAVRDLPAYDLHCRLGHIGAHPGCKLCLAVRASLRRYNSKMRNDASETRAGYRWYGDTITWDTPSRYGYQYTVVLIDAATGYFMHYHCRRKDETWPKLIELITNTRANPYFSSTLHGHTFFTELRLDEAGEWSSKNKEFRKAYSRLGVNVEWAEPPDKRDAAHAENAIRQIEIGTKSIMLESNLPRSWWLEACDHAIYLRNLAPRQRMIKSSDGDSVRPLQILTKFSISQVQCNDILSASYLPGTFCMVTMPGIKGNNTENIERIKPGIALRSEGKITVFEDPARQGTTFKSKSAVPIKLIEGVSVWRGLNLPEPPMPRRKACVNIDGGGDHKILTSIINLDICESFEKRKELAVAAADARENEINERTKQELLEFVDQDKLIMKFDGNGNFVPTGDAYKRVKASEVAGDIAARVPERVRRLRINPESFKGEHIYKFFLGSTNSDGIALSDGVYEGVVTSADSGGDVVLWNVYYEVDQRTDVFDEQAMIDYCLDRIDGTTDYPSERALKMMAADQNSSDEPDGDDQDDDVGGSGSWLDTFNEPNTVYLTKHNDVFADVIAGLGLDLKHHGRAYYEWIRTFGVYGHTHSDARGGFRFANPFGAAKKSAKQFLADVPFPYPIGKEWDSVFAKYQEASLFILSATNTEFDNDQSERNLMNMTYRTLQYQNAVNQFASDECKLTLRDVEVLLAEGVDNPAPQSNTAKTKSTVDPDIVDSKTGKISIPKTFRAALQRSDAEVWMKAWNKEANSLDEKQVIQHDLTRADLRDLGIDPEQTPPIPMGVILDVKYGTDNELEKYKCRNCIKGHPGNVFKGVHYNETFSAAPDMISSRLIGVICMLEGMVRICWDVRTAYLNAECAPSERVPLRYPPEFRHYRIDKDGNKHELFGLLLKNLYGHPAAARNWGKTRDAWIMEYFNTDSFTCIMCPSDECVFKITGPIDESFIMIIHTDDVDAYTTSMCFGLRIARAFEDKWGIVMCNPEKMLGVKRRRWTEGDTEHLELSMPGYITDVYNKWVSTMKTTSEPSTSFPPGKQNSFHEWRDKLSFKRDIDPVEVREVQERGFLSVTGSLLWGGRNVFPDTSFGINQLCKIMSRPTEENWDQSMHLLRWMYKNKDRGIKFSTKGNKTLSCFYDSSFNPDPKDSKCHYGWVIYLGGGPIAWGSHKHQHVSPAVMHAEYCTVRPAADCIIWIRKLLTELGMTKYLPKPRPGCPDQPGPVPIYGDNDMATSLIVENRHTPANRMILREFHLVQEYYRQGFILPKRVNTKRNPSDLLTKSATEPDFRGLIHQLTGYRAMDESTLHLPLGEP